MKILIKEVEMKILIFVIALFLFSSNTIYALEPLYCVSSGCDSTIRYWNVSDGTCIRTFTGHTDRVGTVTFSPDGLYIISGSVDKTIRYWRVSDGSCIRTWEGDRYCVSSVVFSPDGQYVLSGGSDNTMKYWRLSDGTLIRTFTGHTKAIYDVAISPDGQYALSASDDRTAKYWRISDGTCIHTLTGHTWTLLVVDISSDGLYGMTAAVYPDCTIKYWLLSDGSCIRTFDKYYDCSINSAIFSPDDQYVLAGQRNNVGQHNDLNLYRVSDGSIIRTFYGHTNIPTGVDMSLDGQYAISSSFDLTLKYWRVSDGTCIRTFYGHTGRVDEVAFSPIGQTGFKDNKTASYTPAKSFSVSPNPFSSRLSLFLPSSGAIYSLTGQLIMKLTKGKHSIDTSKWKQGIYIVKSGKECKRVVKVR